MLPRVRKWVLVNNSGSLLTFNNNGRINIKETCWYIDPATGKTNYTVLSDDDLGFIAGQSVADGAEVVGDNEVDNTSNLYLGSLVQIEVTHDEGTAADGTFDLYISTGDATGELETDASGYDTAELGKLMPIGSLTWHASGADDEVMRSTTFRI